ncbi:hypothetical protein ACKKBG_A17635 [Auxenochlorella protothecoides x Auxenochlorella symbiontica]
MLSCGRRAAEVVARNPTVRGLASLPAEQVRGSSEIAETVRLSPTAPLLLRLSQRPWGATATLPASSLPADAPATVAVLRDAWAAHDQTPRPLAELIHPLSPCTAAVAASAADWHSRVLVDVYERPAAGGDHALKTVAGDLFHLLRSAGIRPLHVPDVPAVAAQAARLNCLASGARGVRQSTNEVLMVAPTAFGFNEQAAQDNTFMHTGAGAASDAGPSVTHRVVREFAGLHRELADVAGVRVNLFQHSLAHGTPDAVFPNNWFSTHAAGERGGGRRGARAGGHRLAGAGPRQRRGLRGAVGARRRGAGGRLGAPPGLRPRRRLQLRRRGGGGGVPHQRHDGGGHRPRRGLPGQRGRRRRAARAAPGTGAPPHARRHHPRPDGGHVRQRAGAGGWPGPAGACHVHPGLQRLHGGAAADDAKARGGPAPCAHRHSGTHRGRQRALHAGRDLPTVSGARLWNGREWV